MPTSLALSWRLENINFPKLNIVAVSLNILIRNTWVFISKTIFFIFTYIILFLFFIFYNWLFWKIYKRFVEEQPVFVKKTASLSLDIHFNLFLSPFCIISHRIVISTLKLLSRKEVIVNLCCLLFISTSFINNLCQVSAAFTNDHVSATNAFYPFRLPSYVKNTFLFYMLQEQCALFENCDLFLFHSSFAQCNCFSWLTVIIMVNCSITFYLING